MVEIVVMMMMMMMMTPMVIVVMVRMSTTEQWFSYSGPDQADANEINRGHP